MALQYAKMENMSDDLVLHRQSLDLLVLESIKKYAELFILRGLGVDFARTGLFITTDGKWLAFILGQLLSNAAKYTLQGGVRIYGDAESLTIADSGIGIRPEDLQRVFDRGYTGYNGRLDKKASGLGLYMANKVAGTLDMTLSIRSAPGEGTAVTLHFGAGCQPEAGAGSLTKL